MAPYLTEEQRRKVVAWMEIHGSVAYTQRLFQEEFDRAPPQRKTIYKLYRKFCDTGSVRNVKKKRAKTVRTEENVMRVQDAMLNSPQKSIRRTSAELNLSYGSVSRILHDDLNLKAQQSNVAQVKEDDS